MASRKFFHAKPNYIYPTSAVDTPIGNYDTIFEFDEADLSKSHDSSTNTTTEAKKPIPISRSTKKLARDRTPVASASVPMNIPDWSKILQDEYREHGKKENDEDGDHDDRDIEFSGLVPPHEYLAMRRGASFSVHEGVGRTLKGRDLRRVRNAIWKKFGFED